MSTIDFSSLPKENKASFKGWQRVLGTPKILLGALLFAALSGILPFVLQNGQDEITKQTELLALLIVVMAVGYAIIRGNDKRQRDTFRQLAATNNWEYQDRVTIERATLPESVGEAFTVPKVTKRFAITGTVSGHNFTLYEINGIFSSGGSVKGYNDRAVLETTGTTPKKPSVDYIITEQDGDILRVILGGNSITADDTQAMFAAAGLK